MNAETTRLTEAARELLRQCGYFVDNLWHVDDIHFICEQLELQKLSDEEAMNVFKIANEQFDGEAGLSWPKLEQAVHGLLKRKQILESLPASTLVPQDAE